MWPESADLDPQNIIGTSESDQEKTETHSREDTWKCTRIEDTLKQETFVFLLWLWYLEDYDI